MRVVAAVSLAAMLMIGITIVPVDVLAQEVSSVKNEKTEIEGRDKKPSAVVKEFNLHNSNLLDAYNKEFKMDKSNIQSISNNGGNYAGSPLKNAIDGDMNTHWETGKPNSATFFNEVEFTLSKATTLNRIVYAARQTGPKGKGFAQEFEIYASSKENGDNYTLVSSGVYKESMGAIVEIRFEPTTFKRLKFVYKKAHQEWASAAEFQFYKEDLVSEKMERLFTDDTFSSVNKDLVQFKH